MAAQDRFLHHAFFTHKDVDQLKVGVGHAFKQARVKLGYLLAAFEGGAGRHDFIDGFGAQRFQQAFNTAPVFGQHMALP